MKVNKLLHKKIYSILFNSGPVLILLKSDVCLYSLMCQKFTNFIRRKR